MKNEFSRMLDGDLDPHATAPVFEAIKGDAELRRTWSDYQTIGSALRHEGNLGCDLTLRVMTALADEPTILAPKLRTERSWQRPLAALAASAAGVAVVSWIAFGANDFASSTRATTVAQLQPSTSNGGIKPAAQRDIQEYLLAHQFNAPTSRPQGGTQNIRMVSASGQGGR
jgi:sigma-E factor negative regulatory protein RseA